MLRGYLDAVTSSGLVEGWAYDTAIPDRPLLVSIIADDDRELGWGLAHGYRQELVDAGCGAGWCGFRIKACELPTAMCWHALTVVERPSRARIYRRESIPYVVTEEAPIATVQALIAADPTRITSLEQLRGCDPMFNSFITAHGIDVFVRTAYVYLLGRAADPSGLRSYRKYFVAQKVTPYELLLTIADSDEYRFRPRQHCAPIMAAFPFRVD